MINDYYKSNYDEMITFYPRFYRENYEMTAILKAHGMLADGVKNGIDKIIMNNFIDSADENTIEKIEKFLLITSSKERGIAERKRYIKSLFSGTGKINGSLIKDIIRDFLGADAIISLEQCDENGNHGLLVDIPYAQGTLYADDIERILEQLLPAHIAYRIRLIADSSIGLYPVYSLFPMPNIYPKNK